MLRSGSAGLGSYQAGNLRSASPVCLSFVAAKGADLTTSDLVPAYWQRAKTKGPKPKGQP